MLLLTWHSVISSISCHFWRSMLLDLKTSISEWLQCVQWGSKKCFFILFCFAFCERVALMKELFVSACGVPFEVVGAFDINTTTNEIYAHNFPNVTLHQRNIQVGHSCVLFEWDRWYRLGNDGEGVGWYECWRLDDVSAVPAVHPVSRWFDRVMLRTINPFESALYGWIIV